MVMRTLIAVVLLFSGALTTEASQVDESSAQSAARPAAPDQRTDPRGMLLSEQTLADTGYPDGIVLDRPLEPGKLYLRAAPDVQASNGVLRLDLSSAIQNFSSASLEIFVNGTPRRSVDLTSEDATNFSVDVPLDRRDMDRSVIAVSLRYSGRSRDDTCPDPLGNGSFVHVHGSSGLRFLYEPTSVSTVGEAWVLLPKVVTVGLPSGTLSPNIYQAAWEVGSILSRAGHDVRFVRIPDAEELGRAATSPSLPGRDRIIQPGAAESEPDATGSPSALAPALGSSRELASWLVHGESGRGGHPIGLILVADDSVVQRLNADLSSVQRGMGWDGQSLRQLDPADATGQPTAAGPAQAQGGRAATAAAAAGRGQARQDKQVHTRAAADLAAMTLRRIGGQPVILVRQLIPARVARFLAEPWREDAQTPDVAVTAADARNDGERTESMVTLRDLGFESPVTDVPKRAEWSFPFSVRDFPPDHLPSRAVLKVYVGRSPDNAPAVMNVYLNGGLIHSQRVGRATEEVLETRLPRRLLNIDNDLSVVMHRQVWTDTAAELTGGCGAVPRIPVQFADASRIESERVRGVSEFLDLPASLSNGFHAFIPASALSAPQVSLPILSRLGADVLPMAALRDVHFYRPSEHLDTGKHFVVMGDARGLGLKAPAEVQDRTVTVSNREGRRRLAFAGEPYLTLLQIARADGATGLWVKPLHEPPYAVPRSVSLARGDVDFVGQHGVDVTFDSHESERQGSLARLPAAFRYILGALAALLLGILLILWLRRRRTRDGIQETHEEARPTGRAA